MDGYDNDSLPDGAWQAMLEIAVEQFNESNDTNYDPFTEWHNWMVWKQNKNLFENKDLTSRLIDHIHDFIIIDCETAEECRKELINFKLAFDRE